MKQTLESIPRSLIALETGTHSPWVSRLLRELGHQVLVAHAQKVQLISKSKRKDDRHDARTLARLARIDPELLGPVRHRSATAQVHLTVIRARAELVSARTALVNAARGLAKSYSETTAQVWHAASESGAGRGIERGVARGSGAVAARSRIAERAHQAIRRTDGENRQGELPASRAAQTGEGGSDADRADVCPDLGRSASVRKQSRGRLFSGLRPGRKDSGESQPQMHFREERVPYLMTLLVPGAHYILGPFDEPSDLRRWGLKLAARGGKNAKKRAVIAVARKLAVLLHRLSVGGEVYEPLRNSHQAMRAVA